MRLSATVFFLMNVWWAHAQSDELIIQGRTGGLYLGHTVAAKETWYSVGRMYNVDPKALVKYNHLTFAHPLAIGEELKIPLTAVNFSQDGRKSAGESLVPVYHIVGEKEWMYRVSVNHNKVPIPVLEKWNHITGDQVHPGLHMVVGYLKVRTALSALAKRGMAAPGGPSGGAAVAESGGAGTGAPVEHTAREAGEAKEESTDMAGKAGNASEGSAAAAAGRVPKAVMAPASNGGIAAEKRKMDTAAVATVSSPAPHFNGGKFRADFSEGSNSVTGQAGIFKSTSGWQDGKYYALINNVPVGTIVRITDQSTGKRVYAKVLGQLPEMKESAGLTIRISNAAAAELGEQEGRFGVGLSW